MEELEEGNGSPSLQDHAEPEGLADASDPLRPGLEEEDRPSAPLGEPTGDVDAFENEEAPGTVAAVNEQAEREDAADLGLDGDDDDESELEELDDAQFDDFDPNALKIPDKPIQVDETNVGLLGVHKRKRTEEEERAHKKKKKLGKREKPRREKKRKDTDDEFEGDLEIDGKRARKSKGGTDGKSRSKGAPTPEDEENLTPDERRRRALDRKMDDALKAYKPFRRRGGLAAETAADAEIEKMRQRMSEACELDAAARARGEVATHKLKILPEVVELMNRNTIQAQLVDPDLNILQSVRFMLEPADHDAALPNIKIQNELFAILGKLRIGKEALLTSGIGKVVLFYTKSIQPQSEIKRQAERLIGEWMRVVLRKTKIIHHKPIESRTYDPAVASQRSVGLQHQMTPSQRSLEQRKRMLAQPVPGNRARVDGGVGTYTITPVNTLIGSTGTGARHVEPKPRKIFGGPGQHGRK